MRARRPLPAWAAIAVLPLVNIALAFVTVGIIVRMAFDEGALTGKFNRQTVFPKGDFRSDYFRGERLGRVVDRVERIRKDLEGSGYSLPQAALKFSLGHPAVSTVIAGIRNPSAMSNTPPEEPMTCSGGNPSAPVADDRRWR